MVSPCLPRRLSSRVIIFHRGLSLVVLLSTSSLCGFLRKFNTLLEWHYFLAYRSKDAVKKTGEVGCSSSHYHLRSAQPNLCTIIGRGKEAAKKVDMSILDQSLIREESVQRIKMVVDEEGGMVNKSSYPLAYHGNINEKDYMYIELRWKLIAPMKM